MEGFRVWDKIEKKMYYDDFMIGTDGELYKLSSYTDIDEDKFIVNMIPANISRYIIMRKSEIVDTLGNPIYELDIIQDKEKTKLKVEYSDEIGFYGKNEKNDNYSLNLLAEYEYLENEFENDTK